MTASVDTTRAQPRCERCGQSPDKDCYMPPRRCPRPEPTEIDNQQPEDDG